MYIPLLLLPLLTFVSASVVSRSSLSKEIAPAPASSIWANTSVVFSFGDSYTDSNYGKALNASGDASVEDPAFSVESSGPTWINALTSRYNVSDVKLYNLAWAGATIDGDLVVPYLPTVQNLREQVATFKQYFSSESAQASWDPETTLFSFYFGINDIGRSFCWTNVSLPEFYDREMDVYRSLLDELSTAGAKNFLLLNVPRTERTPKFMNANVVPAVKKATKIFNAKFEAMTTGFRSEVEKEKSGYVGLFDDAEVFDTLIDNADTLGFVNVTGNSPYEWSTTGLNDQILPAYPISDYFWVNDYHPSWPVHEILAHTVAKFLAKKQ